MSDQPAPVARRGDYSVEEAAQVCGCSLRTIRRLIKDRKLAAYRLTHQWRITPDALHAYRKQRQLDDLQRH